MRGRLFEQGEEGTQWEDVVKRKWRMKKVGSRG